MRIETHCSDRKLLANAISEHLHEPVRYNRMPTCSYSIGPVTVERDGAVTSDDSEAWAALTPFFEGNGWLTNAAESPEEHTGEVRSKEEEETEEPAETGNETAGCDVMDTCVTVPLADFTAQGMINVIKAFYARQHLINAMTRGVTLFIDEEVITLLADTGPDSIEKISQLLADEARANMIRGIDIENGELRMAFPFREEAPTEWVAYSELMTALAKRALSAQHISSKPVKPEDGEMKYYCNIFLNQLGFGGHEHKDTRRILMDHLHGFAAFRNAEKMDAFKAELAARRREKREGR